MKFEDLVRAARTCRRFEQSQPLTAANLEWLVDCARVAPCGRNAQVLRFVLVHTPEACAALFPHTKWAGALKDWGGPAEGERPTGYIAVLMPKDANAIIHYDVGIAAQSIQLAATEKGWGCCMHASFSRAHCPHILRVPDDMEIGLLLGLGVAREERRLAPMPDDGSFNYWRDAAGVHHVPKRALKDLILAVL